MNRSLSLYLDFVRFSAASVVFLSHVGVQQISGGLLYQFNRYGEAAVDIFFVLSGFVIGYVTTTKEANAVDYAINRLARIYSVALPAVAVSWLLDIACRTLAPDAYATFPSFLTSGSPLSIASALFFSNHFWFGWTQPGMDGPYWSLCFEVWYYVAFGFLAFGRGGWRWFGAAGTLLVAGPKIAALFPLWLLGLGCYSLCRRRSIGFYPAVVAAVVPLACMALLHVDPSARRYPYEEFEPSLAYLWGDRLDYAVGLLFAVNIFGVHALSDRLGPILERFAAPIRYFAGASFTLYLFHYPLLYAVAAFTPWPVADWRTRALDLVAVPIIILAIAAVTERRKEVWRQFFSLTFTSARQRWSN